MANRLIHCCALSCLLFAQGAAIAAQELTDPTRPAVSLEVAEPSSTLDKPGDVNQSQGLRLIIIQKNRRAAIIDGKTIELGGKVGDARLIEVNEGGVVLQGVQGRRVLTLFPHVKMTKPQGATLLPTAVTPAGKIAAMPGENKEKK